MNLKVTCAVILREGRVFAALRGQGKHLSDHWEFPGGKSEEGESLSECIIREMNEELRMTVTPIKALPSLFHDYGEFQIKLYPILCTVIEDTFELKEHANAGWFSRDELQNLKWAAADLPIVHLLINKEI